MTHSILEETMKMRLLVALTGLVISFAVPTFAQQKDTGDPKMDQQIRALAVEYVNAFNRHDAAAVAALFAGDAVRVSGAGESHGQPAIAKSFARYEFQWWNCTDLLKRIDRVLTVGNKVIAQGIWSLTYQDLGATKPNKPDQGHFSWVLVREGDTWKIARETQSESNFHADTNYQ
jgi:uncharacterized protein (TIGR02246 family)